MTSVVHRTEGTIHRTKTFRLPATSPTRHRNVFTAIRTLIGAAVDLGVMRIFLGSMAVFSMMGVGMTPLLRAELRDAHAWDTWQGTFEEVLPYVRDAFERALAAFSQAVDARVRTELTTIVRELCEPDSRLRGHPRNRGVRGNQYSFHGRC